MGWPSRAGHDQHVQLGAADAAPVAASSICLVASSGRLIRPGPGRPGLLVDVLRPAPRCTVQVAPRLNWVRTWSAPGIGAAPPRSARQRQGRGRLAVAEPAVDRRLGREQRADRLALRVVQAVQVVPDQRGQHAAPPVVRVHRHPGQPGHRWLAGRRRRRGPGTVSAASTTSSGRPGPRRRPTGRCSACRCGPAARPDGGEGAVPLEVARSWATSTSSCGKREGRLVQPEHLGAVLGTEPDDRGAARHRAGPSASMGGRASAEQGNCRPLPRRRPGGGQ